MMFEQDDDLGSTRISDVMANPWVSVPYIALSGIASAASPGLARGAYGLNSAVRLGVDLEQKSAERKKNRRLSDALGKYASATTPVKSTKVGMDPKTTTFAMPDSSMRLDQALSGEPPRESNIREEDVTRQPSMRPTNPLAPPAPLPTYETTEQRPLFDSRQQEYLKVLSQADPRAALSAIGSTLFKEPRPVAVRPGGSLVDPRSGEVLYTAPAAEEKPIALRPGGVLVDPRTGKQIYSAPAGPQRPVSLRPGGTLVDPETGNALYRAPAAAPTPKTAEELERIRSATDLNRARIDQVRNSINIANNAKRATVGQLAQALNALSNIYDEGDEATKELLTTAKTALLQEIALRKRADPAQDQEVQITADAKTEMRRTAPNMSDLDFQNYLSTSRGMKNFERWKEHIRTRSREKSGAGQTLDVATAEAILREAGGDKEKARQIARSRGYVIPNNEASASGTTFGTLPPASQYKGRTFNGGAVTSDGVYWRDRNGNIVDRNGQPVNQNRPQFDY